MVSEKLRLIKHRKNNMLDTIRLNIPFDMLSQHGIEVPFSPLMQWMWGQGFITLPMKSNGSYSPKICLRNYYGKRSLSIVVSVPKLYYGNNLYEIGEEDGENIFERLKWVLVKNIPILQGDILDYAVISEVHFWRNIIFTDHTQPKSLIDAISKSKINEHLTYTERDYSRWGNCLRIFCDEYEVCLYDKIHELKNSKAKFDKKKGHLFSQYIDSKRKLWPFEVLRIEVRLKTPKKVKAIWSKNSDWDELNCLNALCKNKAWELCLKDMWSRIFKASYLHAIPEMSHVDFICALKSLGIPHSKDMFSLLGYHILYQDNPQLLNGTFYTSENTKRKMQDKKRYLSVMEQLSGKKNKLEQISQQINANERFRPSDSEEDKSIIFN